MGTARGIPEGSRANIFLGNKPAASVRLGGGGAGRGEGRSQSGRVWETRAEPRLLPARFVLDGRTEGARLSKVVGFLSSELAQEGPSG